MHDLAGGGKGEEGGEEVSMLILKVTSGRKYMHEDEHQAWVFFFRLIYAIHTWERILLFKIRGLLACLLKYYGCKLCDFFFFTFSVSFHLTDSPTETGFTYHIFRVLLPRFCAVSLFFFKKKRKIQVYSQPILFCPHQKSTLKTGLWELQII